MAIADLIGSSETFRDLLDAIRIVAPVDSAVLIQGETGTGKEVIARAIHEASRRRNNPLVSLNCAAIPSALLESELFGHERGAFTGAVAQTVGRFQAADGGTLFLDELGDLPLELQPKLLRALQEKQFERLGSNRTIRTDVRIIAATNQNLSQMVQDKKFRADLYYRLNVFPLTLPPLRERKQDIPLLTEHFAQEFAQRQGKVIDVIPTQVMNALEHYHWPGNIRELQNVIERGVIMTTGRVLSSHTTKDLIRSEATALSALEPAEPVSIKTLADAERAHITAILRETKWVVGGPRGAAAQLGVPRTTLLAKMQRFGIPSLVPRGRPLQSGRRFTSMISGPARHAADESAGLRVVRVAAS
jgi:formate hydrogenlyase transcriptional activator